MEPCGTRPRRCALTNTHHPHLVIAHAGISKSRPCGARRRAGRSVLSAGVEPGNQGTTGTEAPTVAPAPRTINLTQEQRFIIKEIVLKDLNVAKARADAPETIGDAVPEIIDLHPMPPELAAKVPQVKSHTFFVKQDNAIVLVSPSDRRVAVVIH
jgi:hypothetical protein